MRLYGLTMQLPLFSAQKRTVRHAFFSLHPKSKEKKFSAYAPKAMTHFAAKYGIPIVEKVEDLELFDVVFFSLHCFRDFYLVARMAHHKRPGQQWIAGGNACATPGSIGWIMDYVWVGDCRESFPLLLAGERSIEGLYDPRYPDRPVKYIDEDINPEPLSATNIEMSKGCPRRCLFCIHPWRHRYQEAPQELVEGFIRKFPKMRLGLLSNSSDDVSYYGEISELLHAQNKQDMTVSNAVQSFTPQMAEQRKAEMLFGIEGMSERLRWIVNKPISQAMLRDKVGLCLKNSGQIRLIYQFNLPGESGRDFDEFESDAREFQKAYDKGTLALTFIPNQPSAHTPFQWVIPSYSAEMRGRLMDLRSSFIGSGKTGLGVYIPTPLGAPRWFAQVVAEWLPVTPELDAATARIPKDLSVPDMVSFLASRGIKLPPSFLARDESTVFPWSNVVTTGDDVNKWRRFDQMSRKLESPRFTGDARADSPAPSEIGGAP